MLIGVGLLLLAIVLDLVSPLLLKYLIDTALPSGNLGQVNLVVLAFVGLYLGRFTAEIVGGRSRNRFSEGLLLDLRRSLFSHLQTLSLPFFSKNRSGYLASRVLNDASLLSGHFAAVVLGIFTNVVLVCGAVAVILYLDWKLGLVVLLVVPLLVLVTRRFGSHIRDASQEMQERISRLSASVQESIAGVHLIQSYSLESFATERIGSEMKSLRDVNLRLDNLTLLHAGGTLLMTSIAGLSILWFGGRQVVAGDLTLGALMAFLAYAVNVYRPVRELATLNLSIQSASVAAGRVFEILDTRPTVVESPDAKPLRVPVSGRITCEGATFAYEDDDVLAEVSFEIEPGTKVALVGRSGAGKTTLLNLIPRLYDPREGRILIDGQDLRSLSIGSLRSAIGIVSQETFLFSGSIRDNLLCVNPDASEEELLEALEQAHLGDLLQRLPGGLDTEVGERGLRLSGGERQRLSIARVILKDPAILLLDEATSSLDSISENQIRIALDRLIEGGRTCLIIAHRFTTVRDADHILVLDQGKLVGQGTHAHLYSSNAIYSRLYDEQYGRGPKALKLSAGSGRVEEFILNDGTSQSRVVVETDQAGMSRVEIRPVASRINT